MRNPLVPVAISAFCLAAVSVCPAQPFIRLSPAAEAGSEGKQYFSSIWGTEAVTNVTSATLSAFLPDSATATGAAVVVCPGGGFHALAINKEGTEVAKWLAARGIAAFVLRYRVVPTGEDGVQELTARLKEGPGPKFTAYVAETVPLAVADGLTAIRYVREHASEYSVDPKRVGIVGFSAGAIIAISTGFLYTEASRPAFIAPIYGLAGELLERSVPADAPPAFIAAAADDVLIPVEESVKIYTKWIRAGKPTELHLYTKGGHGFGMRKQNLPSDSWIDRFLDWLVQQGFTKSSTR